MTEDRSPGGDLVPKRHGASPVNLTASNQEQSGKADGIPPLVVPDYQLSILARPPQPEDGFVCREPEIATYFSSEEALRDDEHDMARSWTVWHGSDLLGCFALQADAVRLDGRERPLEIPYLWAPAVKVARFGANEAVPKRRIRLSGEPAEGDDAHLLETYSLGEYMLLYIIGLAKTLSASIGVRYLTLDALPRDDLIKWYEEFGFERTNVPVLDYDGVTVAEEINMMLDLQD